VLRLNPSVPLYRDVCGALAVHLYNSQSTKVDWIVAFYLAEGHAPTLRHSSRLNAVRKIRLDSNCLKVCILIYKNGDWFWYCDK